MIKLTNNFYKNWENTGKEVRDLCLTSPQPQSAQTLSVYRILDKVSPEKLFGNGSCTEHRGLHIQEGLYGLPNAVELGPDRNVYVIDKQLIPGAYGIQKVLRLATCLQNPTIPLVHAEVKANKFQAQVNLMKESYLQQQVISPFVVKLHHTTEYHDSHGSKWGLVMEYCNGGDLQKVMKNQRSLLQDGENRWNILEHVLEGLAAIHRKGILHRDIKLENLVLVIKGDKITHTKICDFGWACWHKQQPKENFSYAGTREYQAPEYLQSDHYLNMVPYPSKLFDECSNPSKADIWSLGIVLLTLRGADWSKITTLNQQVTLESNPLEEMFSLKTRRTYSNDNLQVNLDYLNLWMLSNNPLLRPTAQTCLNFVHLLKKLGAEFQPVTKEG